MPLLLRVSKRHLQPVIFFYSGLEYICCLFWQIIHSTHKGRLHIGCPVVMDRSFSLDQIQINCCDPLSTVMNSNKIFDLPLCSNYVKYGLAWTKPWPHPLIIVEMNGNADSKTDLIGQHQWSTTVAELQKIPVASFQNLVERFPRRVKSLLYHQINASAKHCCPHWGLFHWNFWQLCQAAPEIDCFWSGAKLCLTRLQTGYGDVSPTVANLWWTPLLPRFQLMSVQSLC